MTTNRWLLPLLAGALLLACDDAADGGSGGAGGQAAGGAGGGGPLDLTVPAGAGEVRGGLVTDPAALIGGPKADGRVGDAKLYNRHAAFVIEGLRETSGYRHHGGNVVDATYVDEAGVMGPDRFGELFFAFDLHVFAPETFEVISDGRDGEAHVRVVGHTVPFEWADDFVRDLIDPPAPSFWLQYDWRLGPDDRALRLTVTLRNDVEREQKIEYPLLLANLGDGAAGYATGKGLGGLLGAGDVPYLGAVGADLSYAFYTPGGTLSVLFDYSAVVLLQLQPFTVATGRVQVLEYRLLVVNGSASAIDEQLAGAGTGTIAGRVERPASATTGPIWASIRRDGEIATLAAIGDDGAFTATLPPGSYELQAFTSGHAFDDPVAVEVTAGGRASTTLTIPAAGRATVRLHDEAGALLPGRVTFVREGATKTAWPPEDAALFAAWNSEIGQIAYATEGETTVTLPAGAYRAIASRGLTYELHEQAVTIAADQEATLDFTLVRAIDTSGWLSADFHLHAERSPDSDVTFATRVKQAVTEALDLPILTEHMMVSGLGETATTLGLDGRMIGIVGQEVTTFAFGHFNAFPLVYDPSRPNFGGVFEHGRTPAELFAAVRAQSPGDELIQVNHPRGAAAGAYFSFAELDARTGVPGKPERWVEDFDAVEVFNGDCEPGEAYADWIGLTNAGKKKALSSGSDSHVEKKPTGVPRNWIRIDEAALRADAQALVAAVRARRMFVSCGAFVSFETEGGVGLGELAPVDAQGQATFRVAVHAPTWMRVTSARLLENGVPIETWELPAEVGGAERLSTTVRVRPAADAWYALEVQGEGNLFPVSTSGPPYALTNPIELDADGDGVFTPPGAAQ